MPETPTLMDFLLARRSHPARTLRAPAPDSTQLDLLLTAASRVPDHGKLEPWRFVVLQGAACARLAHTLDARAAVTGLDPETRAKAVAGFAGSPMIVTVVASPKASEKIPEIEQTLSAGAVCLSLVNAALASGWGACWLTGWAASDATVRAELGLTGREWIAGFIHIGTTDMIPPERPRPDIAALTTVLES